MKIHKMKIPSFLLLLTFVIGACNSNKPKEASDQNTIDITLNKAKTLNISKPQPNPITDRVKPYSYFEGIDSTTIANLLSVYSTDKAPVSDIKILQERAYHGDEVEEGVDTLNWFAVVKKGKDYFIEKCDITIEPRFDAIIDNEGDTTGKKINTNASDKTILLIAGLKNIVEGKLNTFLSMGEFLNPGDSLQINVNGDTIALKAYGKYLNEYEIRSYLLQASSDSCKQWISATNGFDDQTYSLLWCGDLDKDNKADFIFDLSNHYNVSKITLFLSSFAGEGEFFKRIAEIRSIGC